LLIVEDQELVAMQAQVLAMEVSQSVPLDAV
jgi:hypothetical protein